MIGCDFNLNYIIYRKLLIDKDNLYSKNEENGQKLRHYDVITLWKINVTKLSIAFSESSQNVLSDRLGKPHIPASK